MGRIRQRSIKSVARKLVDELPDDFGKDYQQNKEKLKELNLLDSKTVRNKVAGYIVRVTKNKKF